jgi:hypothetical protein
MHVYKLQTVPQSMEWQLTFRDTHDQNHFQRMDSSDSAFSRRTTLSRGPHSCFVFRKTVFQILASKPSVLTGVFRDFSQSYDETHIIQRTLSLISSPIHYSLITLALDILCSQLLTALLNNNK